MHGTQKKEFVKSKIDRTHVTYLTKLGVRFALFSGLKCQIPVVD